MNTEEPQLTPRREQNMDYPMYERLVALAERGEELPPPLGRFLPKKSD